MLMFTNNELIFIYAENGETIVVISFNAFFPSSLAEAYATGTDVDRGT